MAVTPKLISVAKRQGLRRGVAGGNRMWTAVWAGAALAGFIRKRMNKPEAVERITLQPGQTIVIQDLAISEVDEKKAQKQEQQQRRQAKGRGRRQ